MQLQELRGRTCIHRKYTDRMHTHSHHADLSLRQHLKESQMGLVLSTAPMCSTGGSCDSKRVNETH